MQQKNTPDVSKLSEVASIVLGSFLEHLDEAAAVELGRGLATLVKRLGWACLGQWTPAAGMFDTFMLAALQNREPDTARKWCEANEVPLRKAGRTNAFTGADVIEAARSARHGEETAGKG